MAKQKKTAKKTKKAQKATDNTTPDHPIKTFVLNDTREDVVYGVRPGVDDGTPKHG